jgi:addiction module HigA family antidote
MIPKTMPMKNPPHPGEVLKDLCIEPLGKTLTDIAEKLGVSRKTLSDLVNGKRSLSLDMAIRISKAFGSTPDTWLRMQLNYDLARQEKYAAKIKVPRLVPKSEEVHV